MSLVYVTSRFPFGPGEAFLAPEIESHLSAGVDLRIFPMLPKGGIVHADAAALVQHTDRVNLLRATGATARNALAHPNEFSRAASFAGRGKSRAARMKNSVVLLRAGALVDTLKRTGATHVHAHWGGTSSTLAMMAAEAVGIPWSMTLHRWDIGADNLLDEKIRAACFTRVISRASVTDVRAIVPHAEPVVVHMGVKVQAPPPATVDRDAPVCRLLCVANFVEVKNHRGLIDAFAQLGDLPGVSLDLVGDGPLFSEIHDMVDRRGLGRAVRLLGQVEHDALLQRLAEREWDGVVLASTDAADQHEGVPVSLMEAMAAGIPVLATDSGGARELVGEGAGALVRAGDQEALAAGLARFVSDPVFRGQLADAGYQRVAADFNAERIGQELRRLFATCSA